MSAKEDRIAALKKTLQDEKERNKVLEKAASDRKDELAKQASTTHSGGGGATNLKEEIDLEKEINELSATNSALEVGAGSSEKSQGSKCFYDVDGRIFFLFDYRGATEKADASLAFRRMMSIERQKAVMTGQKLEVDSEKLRDHLEAFAQQFLFASTSASGPHMGWESASLLSQVQLLPVWRDREKFDKFINGKWKRYDHTNISLADFFPTQAGVFNEKLLDNIRSAMFNLETVCVCFFGPAWQGCNAHMYTSLASAEWLRRLHPYLRFVLENFLCDIFLRLSTEYTPGTDEPADLLTPEKVAALYLHSSKNILVSVDHQITWGHNFASVDQTRVDSTNIVRVTPLKKRAAEDEEEDRDTTKKAKTAIMARDRFCLKALFSKFNVGKNKLPVCEGGNCKFRHIEKKRDADAGVIELQMRSLQKKFFTPEEMSLLLTRIKKATAQG